jgi:hypothetical protein
MDFARPITTFHTITQMFWRLTTQVVSASSLAASWQSHQGIAP